MRKGTSFMITVPLSSRLPESKEIKSYPVKIDMEKGNIILIDDETDALDAMAHLLEKWGHHVVPFEAEHEVIQYLSQHNFNPDLIITDFRLREKRTGAQAISSINNFLKKSIPAIIITGDTAKDRMRQAQESGHILLHKPIMPAKLRTVINNTLLKTQLTK